MRRSICLSGAVLFAALVFIALTAAPGSGQYHDDDKWEERHNRAQPPDKVMDAIGVKPGMTAAEIGAGRGRYAVHMAARVGDGGRIYANDIDEESLDYLRERCERDGIENIEIIMGEVADPKLPEGKLDLVYIINSYHHFDDPVGLLAKVIPSLKPDGRLVIIEHDKDKYGEQAGWHCKQQNDLIDEVYRAGFYLIHIETWLEKDNINIFIPRDRIKD
jgi:ubiquinone/menaquinone biosynthesis C-methylase UbiE